MNPTPAKRPRQTLSPSSPASQSSQKEARFDPLSPSKPILPPPIPSLGPYLPPPRPQSWAPGWASSGSSRSGERQAEPGPSRVRSRQSFERESPSSPGSAQMESIDENRTPQVVLTRDTTTRAPRSIMACVRCRKQKMKCDGPGRVPCNGCRAAGLPCVFEPRARPKSISTLPPHPPFLAARPATPGSVPGFYSIQPIRPPGSVEYRPRDLRDPREPMPPPPATSINALTSPFPPPPRPSTPGSAFPPSALAPPYAIHPRPATPTDGRLRAVETAVRGLSSMPNSIAQINTSLGSLQRAVELLASASGTQRPSLEISDATWEDYRSRAWPLTPWLIGLRDRHGMQGLTVDYLGKRVSLDRNENARLASEEAERAVRSEIGRLSGQDIVWTKNEVRALGCFGTWTNDGTLTALAMAHARRLGLDHIWDRRKMHDDWREWVYLAIMDYLSQMIDFKPPITHDMLSGSWRERLGYSSEGLTDAAARDRDRDLKLLGWLEYSETLAEVHRSQTDLVRSPENYDDSLASDRAIVERLIELWRKYAVRWETWAGVWQVRVDPILSLYLNYAFLYTTSPGCLAHESVWTELARDPEGYALLERSRDAGFAVIQAVCSPEIGRTLTYSFALFRPILALALHLVLTLTTLPATIPPLIAVPHIQAVLRSTLETLANARPPDMAPGSGLLGEIVERGSLTLAAGMGGWEMGRDTWRRLVG